VVSPIVSRTSPRPTKSSSRFVPDDGVATDVASSSPRHAQDASDRTGRVSARGTAWVFARWTRVWLVTVRTGSRALAGAETEGVDVGAGVETPGELGGTLSVVEAVVELRAPGAGSGRIVGCTGEREGCGLGWPWAAAFPATAPNTTQQARTPIPCRSLL
jgi:hypothetical protein